MGLRSAVICTISDDEKLPRESCVCGGQSDRGKRGALALLLQIAIFRLVASLSVDICLMVVSTPMRAANDAEARALAN